MTRAGDSDPFAGFYAALERYFSIEDAILADIIARRDAALEAANA